MSQIEHKAVSLRVGTRAVIKRGPIEWRIVCRWCHRGGYRKSYDDMHEAHTDAIETMGATCGACDRRE
ncbi:MAG: hypothetical protein V3S98_06150 [Dehalococcoidia bacterium]